jgi:hypothetical protein
MTHDNGSSAEDTRLLQERIRGVLVRNSSFYSEGPDDKALYLTDLTSIGSLSYTILDYASTVFGAVLPVVSGVSWLLARRQRSHSTPVAVTGSERAATGAIQDVSAEEFRRRLHNLRTRMADPKLESTLKANVAAILAYHGWPDAEASTDAQAVLDLLKSGENSPR